MRVHHVDKIRLQIARRADAEARAGEITRSANVDKPFGSFEPQALRVQRPGGFDFEPLESDGNRAIRRFPAERLWCEQSDFVRTFDLFALHDIANGGVTPLSQVLPDFLRGRIRCLRWIEKRADDPDLFGWC